MVTALLVDSEDAFNSINRNVMLHNVSVVCPTISAYVSNYYQSAPHLFVIGGKEILCTEGTIHRDPTSMGTYALEGGTPLLHFLREVILIIENRSKEVAFADDLTFPGNIKEIKQYWELLLQMGLKYNQNLYSKEMKSILRKVVNDTLQERLEVKNSMENVSNQW